MTPTSTLEYGYATGRQDPPTRLVPASDPEPRSSAIPAQEGLQAEKVIKGMFTGDFRFALNVQPAANMFALKLTGSMTGASATQSAFYINYTWDGTTRHLVDWQILGSPTDAQSYLRCVDDGVAKMRITGIGRVLHTNGSAGAPGVAFIDEPSSGFYRNSGFPNRVVWAVGAFAILESELIASNKTRTRTFGTTYSLSEPQICWQGDIDVGLLWTAGTGDDINNNRMGLVAGDQALISVWTDIPAAGKNWSLVRFDGQITKSSSGTHARFNLVEMKSMPNGTGSALVTDATTLYLEGAPSVTLTGGKNRAIWVRKATGGGLVEFEHLFRVNAAETGTVGGSVALVEFTGTITEAGSGNHPRLSLLELTAPAITAGAATVTDGTTLYISGAPAGVVTGKNRALWVVAGEAEFGGVVTVGLDRGLRFTNQTNQAGAGAGTLANAPAAGDPAIWIPVMVNGVNRAIPAW